jgi:hypothetical protein
LNLMITVTIRENSGMPSQGVLDLVQEIATVTEAEVRTHLPCLPLEIALHVGHGTRTIPETNELGASVSPGLVWWTINTAQIQRASNLVRTSLRRTLFHELHHQARGWVMRGGTPKQTFIEAPVAEGLATAYERDGIPWQPPWAIYPEETDSERWVRELLRLPTGADYRQWMFRHADGRRWVGYKAGTFIVDRAMTASALSAADLVTTPAADILALAGFG